MATLHEMAVKLQEYIMEQASDRRSSGFNPHKYNNLKLRMDGMIDYPHVIIAIGISEAIYNVKDVIKIDGGLGSDERYVRKWLEKTSTIDNLVEIYNNLTDLTSVEDEMSKEDEPETPVVEEAMATGVRSTSYEQHQRERLKQYMMSMEDDEDDERENEDDETDEDKIKSVDEESDEDSETENDEDNDDDDDDDMTVYSFD